jgi:hypothetical protein
MSTKLVCKQLLLDPQDLFYIEQIIKQKPKYTSLSQFVRELLKKEVLNKPKAENDKKQKLLAMAGCIKPGLNSDPNAATNHNDIYNI